MAISLFASCMLFGSFSYARDLRDCLKFTDDNGVVEYTCNVSATIAFCLNSYTLSSDAAEVHRNLAHGLSCQNSTYYHDPCDLTGLGRCNTAKMQAWARQIKSYETRWTVCEGEGEVIQVFGNNLYRCGPTAASKQESELDRSELQRIQVSLAKKGFDPGPADGVFGPRTCAAIIAWQEARGEEATGNLDEESAKVLLGAKLLGNTETSTEAGNVAERHARELSEQSPGMGAAEANKKKASSETTARSADAPIALKPLCEDIPRHAACWKEIANKSECSAWDKYRDLLDSLSLTWSGACSGARAVGTGTLLQGRTMQSMGTLVDGRKHGHWTEFFFVVSSDKTPADPDVEEGPYVDSERHGHWVIHDGAGRILREGSFVDGKRHGEWDQRYPIDGDLRQRCLFACKALGDGPFASLLSFWPIEVRHASDATRTPTSLSAAMYRADPMYTAISTGILLKLTRLRRGWRRCAASNAAAAYQA